MRRFEFLIPLLCGVFAVPVFSAEPVLTPDRFHKIHRSLSGQANAYLGLPLRFEQSASGAYRSKGLAYELELTPGSARFRAGNDSNSLVMRFQGAHAEAIAGEQEFPGRSNYLVGDPKNWRCDVAAFGKVRYRNLWPGVDAVFYGNQKRLEYDLELQPGADPAKISLSFEGMQKLRVDSGGALAFRMEHGELRQIAPVVYQETASGRRKIASSYVLRADGTVGFSLGSYDPGRKLTIDPIVDYATYIGGAVFDFLTGIALDSTGNVYLTGFTMSPNITTGGAFDRTLGATDAFVMKLDASGSQVQWTTYFGGNGDENPWNIAVDSKGQAVIGGTTSSTDLPIRFDATQVTDSSWFTSSSNRVGYQGFVAKFNAVGTNVVFSNYVGGTRPYDQSTDGTSLVWQLALDRFDNIYLTGDTSAADFPVRGTLNQFSGLYDVFVMKLDPNGSRVYSSLIGGDLSQFGFAIAVDSTGVAYVAGTTNSTFFFPQRLPPQNHPLYGDVFLVGLSADGQSPVGGRFFGGTKTSAGPADDVLQEPYKVVVDANRRVHLTGWTATNDFRPIVSALQSTSGGGVDGFYARLDSNLTVLNSTYLGGTGDDWGLTVTVDPVTNNPVIAGLTNSPNFPVKPNAVQRTFAGGAADGFATTISGVDGQTIVDSTFFGGGQTDFVMDIAASSDGALYLVGPTQSPDFPTTSSAFIRAQPGAQASFLVRLANPSNCRYSLNTGQLTPSSAGAAGTLTINISGLSACAWTASTNSPAWVQLSSNRGTGNSLGYTFARNATGAAREAYINVSGQSVHVTQFAQDCQFSSYPDRFAASNSAFKGGLTIVTTSAACPWTPTSDVPWITVPSTSRSGGGVLNVVVDPNSGSALRTGNLTVGNLKIPVVQNGAGCRLQVTSSQGLFYIGGGNGQAQVQASGDSCSWTASSTDSWIRVVDRNGSGSGILRFVVSPNGPTALRTGKVTVGDQNLPVVQLNCQSDPRSPGACEAPATASLTSAPRLDDGKVLRPLRFDRAKSAGDGKFAGGQCEISSVTPNNVSVVPDGGSQEFTINFSGSGCRIGGFGLASWIVNSLNNDLVNQNGPSVKIRYTFNANADAGPSSSNISFYSYVANKNVSNLSVPVTRSGRSCQVAAANNAADFGPTPDKLQGSIAVTTSSADCSWNAAATETFISLPQGSSGRGNSQLNFELSQNTSATARTGTIRLNDSVDVRIVQRGVQAAACVANFVTGSRAITSDPGTYSVSISTSPAGCAWQISGTGFLSVPIASGSGDASATYTVSQNTATTSRTATLSLQGAGAGSSDVFTVSQDGKAAAVNPPIISSFTASPSSVGAGQASTLQWVVSGADSVSINQGIGIVVSNGTRVVNPFSTTTYTLTATKLGADSATANVTVTVNPITAPVVTFTASPTSVNTGQSSTLTWNVTGANSVSIDNGIGGVAPIGTRIVSPTATTTYTITASNATSSTVQSATVTVVSNGPVINAGGVVTVAAGAQLLAPLGLVSIYGQRFTNNVTANWNGATLTPSLGGASVTIDGRPAYPLFVSPTFMNVQVPDATTRALVNVTVTNASGTSAPVQVQMATLAPEFKGWGSTPYVEANRSGPRPPAAPTCPNVACPVAPAGVLDFSAPAQPGETISLWALGFGPSNPPIAAGVIGGNPAPLTNSVTVTVGGTNATVPFGAFLQGVGLYQINIIVPTLPDGEYDIVATVGGTRTLKTMKLAIKR